jgi:hypothetical protein
MPNVHDELLERTVSHQIYLERFKSGEARKARDLLDKLVDDTRALLVKREGVENWTTSRIERLLEQLQNAQDKYTTQIDQHTRTSMRDLGRYEANFEAELIKRALPIQWDVTLPTTSQIYAAATSTMFLGGSDLSDSFNQLRRSVRRTIELEVRQGFAVGRPITETTRLLFGTETVKGAFETEYNKLSTFV